MITVSRYCESDQPALEALHRRVIGDRAESLKQRWRWLYFDNPGIAGGAPPIWVARDGEAVVGEMGALPVRLQANGREIDALWGSDFMVEPALQRLGIGHLLAAEWEAASGASLALSMTDASVGFFTKRGWRPLPQLARLSKPLTRRVLDAWGRRSPSISLPVRRAIARRRPLGGDVRSVDHFDDAFTRLWTRVAPRFAFAVRRDAAYLEWKFRRAPHLTYSVAALVEHDEIAGFVVYRHVEEDRWRVTLLVDYLADPERSAALVPLLRWLDREAIAAGSDLIRVLAPNESFQRTLVASGYVPGQATTRMMVSITGVPLPTDFHDTTRRWHVTQGDSDVDR